MNGAVATIVAGKELADHVVHRPGPLSVSNILRRMIHKCENHSVSISLDSLASKVPMGWRTELMGSGYEGALLYCPLHSAMVRSASVEDDPSWATLFSKHFRHSTTVEISPSVLGYQMYHERMLCLEFSKWS